MSITFQRARKTQSYLRMAIAGPSGSGKTWSSLTIASGLVGPDGKIAVIDTERGSASKYANEFVFDVVELDSYHPDRFIEAIEAAQAAGYQALIIDSLSHAWNGTGGALELHDQAVKRQKTQNTYTAWADVTPLQNHLINAITGARMHVIATMRAKTEYVQEKNERGGTSIRKVGMAPIQRDGMEYEFDIYCQMDIDHNLIVEKSRCTSLAGAVIARPSARLGAETLREWLSDGETPTAQPAHQTVTPASSASPKPPARQPSSNNSSDPTAKWRTIDGYNPLGDAELRKRLTALGANSIEKVEKVLAYVRDHQEYSRTEIYAYVGRIEAKRGNANTDGAQQEPHNLQELGTGAGVH